MMVAKNIYVQAGIKENLQKIVKIQKNLKDFVLRC